MIFVSSHDDDKLTRPTKIRLAKSSSHLFQLVLASLPLFVVLLYFLYEAVTRPSKPIYNLNDDVQDDTVINQAYANTGALIPLIDMLPVFLTFEGLWLWLCVYCVFFIPRRRALMKSYLESGETALGDVVYDEPGLLSRIFCAGGNYASLEYTYPNSSTWWIKKKVRVYERYSREKITIVKLLNRPYSGQPRVDVEIDVQASSDARNESKVLAAVSFAWAIFCWAGAALICVQISKLKQDDYEDSQKAQRWFFTIGCIGLPVVVTVVNFFRWVIYRHSIVNRGMLYIDENDDDHGQTAEDEGVQVTMWREFFQPVSYDDSSLASYHETDDEHSRKNRNLV